MLQATTRFIPNNWHIRVVPSKTNRGKHQLVEPICFEIILFHDIHIKDDE